MRDPQAPPTRGKPLPTLSRSVGKGTEHPTVRAPKACAHAVATPPRLGEAEKTGQYNTSANRAGECGVHNVPAPLKAGGTQLGKNTPIHFVKGHKGGGALSGALGNRTFPAALRESQLLPSPERGPFFRTDGEKYIPLRANNPTMLRMSLTMKKNNTCRITSPILGALRL